MGCFSTDDDDESDPVDNRGCTDILWFFLFVIFCMLLIIVACFAHVYGNPKRLINGYDSYGNTCGMKNPVLDSTLQFSGRNLESEKYLLFMDYQNLSHALQICVKKCPTHYMNSIFEIQQFYQSTGSNLCNYDFDFHRDLDYRVLNAISGSQGPCPKLPIYQSTPIINRCIPTLVKNVSKEFISHFYSKLNEMGTLKEMTADLYESWYLILLLIVFTLVLTLITCMLIHYLAKFVSSIIILVVIISTLGTTGFLWHAYFDLKFSIQEHQKTFILLETIRNENAMFYISIVASIITLFILISIFLMRKQVDFLADLFQETTKCLKSIPCLFIQPFVTFIFLSAYFIFWMYVVTCLATATYPTSKDINSLPNLISGNTADVSSLNSDAKPINISSIYNVRKLRLIQLMDLQLVPYMWVVMFVALLWIPEFMLSCQQMIISGAVAHWYYREKFKNQNNHVSYAVCKLIKYHLGSVAKGSFLIMLFRIPRLILTYLYAKAKQTPERAQNCLTYSLKCCMCCFYCLEKCIRYLTHNAYTVVAIDGKNFCSAASTAFHTLASHSLEVATINSLGDFILFLSKCIVTAISISAALFMFRKDGKLHFFAAPILIVAAFSYFIAHCIITLYEMVLDTVYLCMCQNGEVRENIQLKVVHVKTADNINNEDIPMAKDS